MIILQSKIVHTFCIEFVIADYGETDEEEATEPTVIDYDNRMLCSTDKVDVALKDIHYGGITLTITSKTSKILTLSCDGLAFDGQCIYHGNFSIID